MRYWKAFWDVGAVFSIIRAEEHGVVVLRTVADPLKRDFAFRKADSHCALSSNQQTARGFPGNLSQVLSFVNETLPAIPTDIVRVPFFGIARCIKGLGQLVLFHAAFLSSLPARLWRCRNAAPPVGDG